MAAKKASKKVAVDGIAVSEMSDQRLKELSEAIGNEVSEREEKKLGDQAKSLKKEYEQLLKTCDKGLKVKFSLTLPIDFELLVEPTMGDPESYDIISSKTKLQGDFTKKQRQWLVPAIQEAVENACESIIDIIPEDAYTPLKEFTAVLKGFEKKVNKETDMGFYQFEEVIRHLNK